MTVYTVSTKKHRIAQKKDFWSKIENFLNRYEAVLTIISVIILLTTGFFFSVAFGNPVTN